MNIEIQIQENMPFLRLLSPEQLCACIHEDSNYVLIACPGSGKTRTLIYRLAYFICKYPTSHKTNIAITYTNRAANEIRDRIETLGIDDSTIWTGTIHQFCIEYIIRPYRMYAIRLKYGYTIIDEFVTEIYLKEICSELGIEIPFWTVDKALANASVQDKYLRMLFDKRELDFDHILSESISLLQKNKFIAQNIANIVRSIQVDEYQDTNRLQYEIISEIAKCNNKILVSFVGDVNQAIYSGLGGVAMQKTELEQLFCCPFSELQLTGCYRSTQKIVDFYHRFQVKRTSIKAVSDIANLIGTIYYEKSILKNDIFIKISEIIQSQLNDGVPQEEICVLAPQWWMLYSLIKDLKESLKEVKFDAPELTPVKFELLNPFYLLTKLLFTRSGRRVKYRKKLAKDLVDILATDFGVTIPYNWLPEDLLKTINSTEESSDGIVMIHSGINNLAKSFNIKQETHQKFYTAKSIFYKKMLERIKRYELDSSTEYFRRCFEDRRGIVISTFHGIKGEEYTTVIAFGLLQGYVPNWNTIICEGADRARIEAQHLVYVVCSRAKKNLFLFSEQGHCTQKGAPYYPTEIMNI